MKYIVLIASVLAIVVFISSCKSSKKIVLDTYEGPKLVFGSGGGFAGTSSERILLPNGQIYLKANRSKQFGECESIDKKLAQQMFDNYKTLGFDKLDLYDPGNMTYFMSLEEKGVSKKITWGGSNVALDPNVKKFFNTLGQITNKKQLIK